MKTAFFVNEEWEKEYFQKKAHEVNISDIDFIKGTLSKDSIPQGDYEGLVVFINSKVDKEVIDAFPNLKFVATRSTGFDHIDVKQCAEKGVTVMNVPTYGTATVAEHVFALLLTLSKNVYISYDQIRETGSFSLEGMRGFDLEGKTLGVVGTGNIGLHTIQIAKGFGMRVVAYDVYPKPKEAERLGFEYKTLDEVLGEGDIVTIHVPYNEYTHHLIGRENLYKMKKGAVLINTSRGGVVETEALVSALKDGHLAGAGLDVLEEEGAISDELGLLTEGHPEEHNLRTLLSNHVLIDMPNVIITPHNAFNTQEALQRILNTTLENIKSFYGGNPINTVTVA